MRNPHTTPILELEPEEDREVYMRAVRASGRPQREQRLHDLVPRSYHPQELRCRDTAAA
jgi:hypothetical protein